MNFEIRQQFRLESSRFLPHLPPSHPCARMHGHSFVVWLVLQGPLQRRLDWVIDYNDVLDLAAPLIKLLDHRLLNEVPGLSNPTTENLTKFIYDELKKKLPLLTQVIVSETPTTECRFPVPQ